MKEKELLELFSEIKKKNKILNLHEPYLSNQDLRNVVKSIKSKHVAGKGEYVKTFEQKISQITDSRFVIACSTGTAALHLALKSIKINSEDEVLIPALNFISSANAVLYCGAKPHFIDVSKKTLGVDPEKLSVYLKKIGKYKKNNLFNKFTGRKIKAIIPMHTFGHPCEIDKILKITRKYNIICIEDAAEAIGSFFKKKHVGTFGLIGILSFNGNKTVTAGGGGAVLTSNKHIEKKIRNLSNQSKLNHNWKYDYEDVGYNYRMPNLNAALGCSQLDKLKYILKQHRKIFHIYKKRLHKIKFGKIFQEPENCVSNYWLQTFVLNKPDIKFRDKLLNKTNKKNIHTRPAWQLMSNVKYLKHFPRMDLKNSKDLFCSIINLPSSFKL